MKYLMTLWFFLSLCVPLHAENIKPTDFAYGMTLKPIGDGAIYSLTLPEDVYNHTTRTDLGDVRVFNGSGEVVPHAITQQLWDKSSQPKPVSLPFFPLFTCTDGDQEGLSMEVKTSDRGTIINVTTASTNEDKKGINAYLFDLSNIDPFPNALVLKWTKPEGDLLINNVVVKGSNDLKTWQTLDSRVTLAELKYMGHTLYKNAISLTGRPQKYIRMTWPGQPDLLALQSVWGQFAEKKQAKSRHWNTVSGKKDMDKEAYFFDTEKTILVDRLNLQLEEKNCLIHAVLKSRRDENGEWKTRARGLFYRLDVNGTTLKNDAVSLAPTMGRHWRLEITSDDGGLGDKAPQLQFGWLPHRLFFLARGQAPFQLAYGSTTVLPPKHPVNTLLDKIDERQKTTVIKPALADPQQVLGGDSALQPPQPEIPWKQYLLWGILIAGVFVLGLMAAGLYRQMDR